MNMQLTNEEVMWLEYAIAHMLDDSEPEDATCAKVLQALLDRLRYSAPALRVAHDVEVIDHPDYVTTAMYSINGRTHWRVDILRWDTRDAHVHLYSTHVSAAGYDTQEDAEIFARKVAAYNQIEYRP